MKTIFDQTTREELLTRIKKLDETNTAQWGKMNIYQMVKHCTLFDEMILGRQKYKQSFIGYLFGKMALKGMIKDERPVKINMPTVNGFKVTGNGDVTVEKNKWISLVEEYSDFSNYDFVHPFFGKMTTEQIGYLVYKHTDHHLRQFNA